MNKRQAILVYPQNSGFVKPLLGIENDMNDWKEFLKSTIGGSWGDDEIKILNISNAAEIHHYLIHDVGYDYDYILFAFFGHGAYDMGFDENMERKGDFVYCSSYSSIYLSEIKRLLIDVTKNGLIYLDCCRTKVPCAPIYNDFSVIPNYELLGYSVLTQKKPDVSELQDSVQRKKIKLNDTTIFLETTKRKEIFLESQSINLAEAQRLWWSKMPQNNGISVIHSCSVDECAYECEIDGRYVGLFTYFFINSSIELTSRELLTAYEAFKLTCNNPKVYLKEQKYSEEQNPECDPPYPNYPFAVFPQKMKTILEVLDEAYYKKIKKQIVVYNSTKALFECFLQIPKSCQPLEIDTLSKVIKGANIYALPNVKGGVMYSICFNRNEHDESKGCCLPAKHKEFFKSLGFAVPESGILDYKNMRDINYEEYSAYIWPFESKKSK